MQGRPCHLLCKPGLFQERKGTNWIGRWEAGVNWDCPSFAHPLGSLSGHPSPGQWAVQVLFNSFRTLSLWTLPSCDVLLVSSVYLKNESGFLLPLYTTFPAQMGL